jgi:PIN domain nuclease of toxin-antitoxin system
LPRELSANKFALLGIELAHATFIETLPPHHKDPFDRLLVAQSLLETMPVVSADVLFDQYGVSRLWN